MDIFFELYLFNIIIKYIIKILQSELYKFTVLSKKYLINFLKNIIHFVSMKIFYFYFIFYPFSKKDCKVFK